MRIQKSGNRPEGPSAGRARGASGPVGSADGKSFDSFLQDNKHRSMKEKLAFMLEDIKKQGETLGNRMNLEGLMAYKKSIAEFLDVSTRHMLELKKEDYLDHHGRHHIYALVRRIDSNLERLTQEMVRSQKDQLTILSYIDDIRGLLMDMAF
ncbi:MAG TPA: YaaR family protein [Clostridia bacterium]|nr:YaaR family protein [Clostridia bacterium]